MLNFTILHNLFVRQMCTIAHRLSYFRPDTDVHLDFLPGCANPSYCLVLRDELIDILNLFIVCFSQLLILTLLLLNIQPLDYTLTCSVKVCMHGISALNLPFGRSLPFRRLCCAPDAIYQSSDLAMHL